MISRLLTNPFLLLTLTALAWAGNTIAGRLAVGEVSPMVLTTLRWVISFTLMGLFVRADVARALPLFRQRPLYLTLMGIIGFTGFNAIYYVAAHYTSAANLGIMQSSTPLFVMIGAVLLGQSQVNLAQVIGLAIGLAGVLIVVTTGRWEVLHNLAFNIGDLLLILISAMYAGYSLGLRHRPQGVPGLTFFAAMALVAAITSLPPLIGEIVAGKAIWPTQRGWLIVAYVAVLPSLLAQVWYIRGVAALGAARSGYIFYAIPVFASVMAVVFLGEPFGWYHAAGLVLVLGGIAFAERFGIN
ncbi:MAG TPA: DMT family transporter [Beijerinckiaceae bacterium]|nr:DMT family transporter [Beijerinckiaceae bacterium]